MKRIGLWSMTIYDDTDIDLKNIEECCVQLTDHDISSEKAINEFADKQVVKALNCLECRCCPKSRAFISNSITRFAYVSRQRLIVP